MSVGSPEGLPLFLEEPSMTKYEVLKTFVDSVSGERKVPGDKVYGTVEADEHRAADLARNGLIKLPQSKGTEAVTPVPDDKKPASSKPADTAKGAASAKPSKPASSKPADT